MRRSHDYLQVARLYRQAVEHDLPVAQTVAIRLGVTEGTARQLIRRARVMGLLGPGVGGRKGETP